MNHPAFLTTILHARKTGRNLRGGIASMGDVVMHGEKGQRAAGGQRARPISKPRHYASGAPVATTVPRVFGVGLFTGTRLWRVVAWSSIILMAIIASAFSSRHPPGVPDKFVDIRLSVPSIKVDMRYFGDDNFLGQRVDGYTSEHCWVTEETALALAKVQAELRLLGLSLKIYDGYRPQDAVDHFMRWTHEPEKRRLKQRYHPAIPKAELFDRGYIEERSGHSRGSSVDVTIISLENGKALDMGTHFDFFDPRSHTLSKDITPQQRANRLLLNTLMERYGFSHHPQEWWHFTLAGEPFPDTYFNFPTGGTF